MTESVFSWTITITRESLDRTTPAGPERCDVYTGMLEGFWNSQWGDRSCGDAIGPLLAVDASGRAYLIPRAILSSGTEGGVLAFATASGAFWPMAEVLEKMKP